MALSSEVWRSRAVVGRRHTEIQFTKLFQMKHGLLTFIMILPLFYIGHFMMYHIQNQ